MKLIGRIGLAHSRQQPGSVWGHGGYVAPDWSADWLQREVLALCEELATRDFALGVLILAAYVLKLLGREPGAIPEGGLASASETA